jgi:hypothetical protein
LLPSKSLLNGINKFNFRYTDGFKIKNKYFPAISRTLYLSTETIRRPPQSHETIPLNQFNCYLYRSCLKICIYSFFLFCKFCPFLGFCLLFKPYLPTALNAVAKIAKIWGRAKLKLEKFTGMAFPLSVLTYCIIRGLKCHWCSIWWHGILCITIVAIVSSAHAGVFLINDSKVKIARDIIVYFYQARLQWTHLISPWVCWATDSKVE